VGPGLLINVLDKSRCADVGQTELAVDKLAVIIVDLEVLLEPGAECREGFRYELSDGLLRVSGWMKVTMVEKWSHMERMAL